MNALPKAIITPSLLKSIRRHPNLPRNTWYFVTATALSILNRPDEIHKVYKHALENGPTHIDTLPNVDEQLRITRRMREALVKAAAIGGLPKVYNLINIPRNDNRRAPPVARVKGTLYTLKTHTDVS